VWHCRPNARLNFHLWNSETLLFADISSPGYGQIALMGVRKSFILY